jgi:hypothetical protein
MVVRPQSNGGFDEGFPAGTGLIKPFTASWEWLVLERAVLPEALELADER